MATQLYAKIKKSSQYYHKNDRANAWIACGGDDYNGATGWWPAFGEQA